jgi:hypothetical protein
LGHCWYCGWDCGACPYSLSLDCDCDCDCGCDCGCGCGCGCGFEMTILLDDSGP